MNKNHRRFTFLGSFLFALFLSGCSATPTKPAVSLSHLPLSQYGRTAECCRAVGRHWAVSSGGVLSTRVARYLQSRGGNLIDGAVGVLLALNVERPFMTGLAGGGFMLLHWSGKSVFLDFRETAPQHFNEALLVQGLQGGPARAGALVGTPGMIAGLYDVHRQFGKLPWADVVFPSVLLAEKGFPTDPLMHQLLGQVQPTFSLSPDARAIFYPKGQPLQPGELVIQKDLGKVLRSLAKDGPAAFYSGFFAKKIAGYVQRTGGVLSEDDLRKYKVKVRQPLQRTFRGLSFLTAPPPSSGGTILSQVLTTVEDIGKPPPSVNKESGPWRTLSDREEARFGHGLIEVFRNVYADRAAYGGDPDFSPIPVDFLTSNDRIRALRAAFDSDKAISSEQIRPFNGSPPEDHGTTGAVLMDGEGNVVTATITINKPFGNQTIVPGTGLILNDEMEDFSLSTPGQPELGAFNKPGPLKRPMSSMAPTIFFHQGKAVLGLTGAGGSRIPTALVQTILHYFNSSPPNLRSAIFAPRLHHQWKPDRVQMESSLMESEGPSLRERGHQLEALIYPPRVHAVAANSTGLEAVFDARVGGGSDAW